MAEQRFRGQDRPSKPGRLDNVASATDGRGADRHYVLPGTSRSTADQTPGAIS